jgi:amino acid transporter
VLTVAKALGLSVIVIAGFGWGAGGELTSAAPKPYLGFGLSMVLVLYAYGGWSDAAFVAAEVRNRQRNIPLALLLGTTGIMLVYLLVNGAYLYGLGFEGLRDSEAPAAAVLEQAWGAWGGKGISLLVMLSALGAINGLIFTGARIHVSLGKDHRLFAWLGHWNSVRGTPPRALLAQSAIAVLLVVLVGTDAGRTRMDSALRRLGFQPLPGEQTLGGFETLVAGTAPVFWAFFLMTGVAMFVLRAKDPHIDRPFRAPLYPLEPIVFCGTCLYMLYSSLVYARGLSMLGLVPLLIGVPLYGLSRRVAPLEELTAPES